MDTEAKSSSVISIVSGLSAASSESIRENTHENAHANNQKVQSHIFEAACKVIAEKGIKLTTIEDITSALSISEEAFKEQFPTLEHLIERIGAELLEVLLTVEDRAREYRDPAARFATYLRFSIRRARQEPTWGWLMHHFLRDGYEPLINLSRRILKEMIEAGIAKGQFTAATDKSVYDFIYGGLRASLYRQLIDRMDESYDKKFTNTALRCLGMASVAAQDRAQRHLI